MGKGGRIACIFVPMALTIVSLVLLALVGLGQTNSKSYYLSNLYFLRANVSGAAAHGELFDSKPNNQTVSADVSDGHIELYNSYSIGLWNYCAGGGLVSNETNKLHNYTDPAGDVAFCSGRETDFAFNPTLVWGLPSAFTTRFFSSSLDKALSDYENGLAHAIGPLYIVTVGLAALNVLIGIGAIFSRIGSILTTLASLATAAFAFGFAIVSTIAYFGLEGAFNEALKSENITVAHGAQVFAFVWLVVAASLTATLFWAFSSCCVSGRSSHRDRPVKEVAYGGSGTGYQRMSGGEPAYGQSVPLTQYGAGPGREGAYEPFRHA